MKLDNEIWTYKKPNKHVRKKDEKPVKRLAFTFEENKKMAKYKRWNIN